MNSTGGLNLFPNIGQIRSRRDFFQVRFLVYGTGRVNLSLTNLLTMSAMCDLITQINGLFYIFKGLSLQLRNVTIDILCDNGFVCTTRYQVIVNYSRLNSSTPKVSLNVLNLRTFSGVFVGVTKYKGNDVVRANDDRRLMDFFKGVYGVATISASSVILRLSAFLARLLGCASHVKGAKFRSVMNIGRGDAKVQMGSHVNLGNDMLVQRARSPKVDVYSRGQGIGRLTNRCIKDANASTSRYDSNARSSNIQALNATGARFRSKVTLNYITCAYYLDNGGALVIRGIRSNHLCGLDFRSQYSGLSRQLSQRSRNSLQGYMSVANRSRITRVLGRVVLGSTGASRVNGIFF